MPQFIYKPVGAASERKSEFPCRFFVKAPISVRVEVGFKNVSCGGQPVRTTYNRSFRNGNQHASGGFQLPILQPVYIRSKCAGTARLAAAQQLCQSTSVSLAKDNQQNQTAAGSGNGHSTILAGTAIYAANKKHAASGSSENTKISDQRHEPRGPKKQKMETVCLDNIWRGHLRRKNWMDEQIDRLVLSWAPSTLKSYTAQVRKNIQFCEERKIDPGCPCSHEIAMFFTELAES